MVIMQPALNTSTGTEQSQPFGNGTMTTDGINGANTVAASLRKYLCIRRTCMRLLTTVPVCCFFGRGGGADYRLRFSF